MLYSAPEVPPMARRAAARPFRVAPASLRGKESRTAALIASAPLLRVDPQSPSPILHAGQLEPMIQILHALMHLTAPINSPQYSNEHDLSKVSCVATLLLLAFGIRKIYNS